MAETNTNGKPVKIHIDPTADFIFTTIFLGQIFFAFYMLKENMQNMYILAALHVAVAVAINFSKFLTKYVAYWFSKTFLFDHPMGKKKTLKKFCDQSWQLYIHVAMTAAEYWILFEEDGGKDYATNTTNLWVPLPKDQIVPDSVRYIYLTQLAIWIVTCTSHRFIEEKHKDYFLMYAHHIVTIFLVAFSWVANYQRVGLLVLFIHDASDVIPDLLKMFNYMKLEGMSRLFLTEISFISNLVSWAFMRLYIYPKYVLYSCWVESRYYVSKPHWDEEGGVKYGFDADGNFNYFRAFTTDFFPEHLPYGIFLPALLTTLFVMHIFWFCLFLRMLKRLLSETANDVGAAEYEGGSDEEDENNEDEKKAN